MHEHAITAAELIGSAYGVMGVRGLTVHVRAWCSLYADIHTQDLVLIASAGNSF